MTLALIAVLIGFVALVWSADQFVTGAAVTARFMGMSRLMIGLTVVAFGTSAPEIFVSLNASMKGAGDMAVGNALGSNLANVGMVLAVTAIIVAIPIPRALMRRELPILLFITALTGVLLYDHHLGWLDGALLLASLIIGGVISIRSQDAVVLGEELGLDASECETGIPDDDISQKHAWWLLIGGLVVLVASSRLLVWGAQEAAQLLGVSQLVIGLTLLAVGTSLPELAASVACAFKGHVEIALGNVVGSNIFNLAAVLAIPALLGGVQLEPAIFSRDYLYMAGITLCLVVAIAVDAMRVKSDGATQPKLGKIAAALFLLTYGAYYLQLFSDL
ncbi:MAG: calcium/sodium antiporter [Pseudomonadales bacterium]